MKRIPPVLFLGATLAFSLEATAQGSAQRSTTTKTADYVERRVDGDQVVKFTGDELVGPTNGVFGDVVRPLPGAVRVQLIRPRLNFIPELLKTVENL